MHSEQFYNTSIGSDYLRTPRQYPIDTLLDYLSGLMKMRSQQDENPVWKTKYSNEINAVIEILKKQTA